MMASLPMDHETRANRLLGAMKAVEDMLCGTACGARIEAEAMAQLFSMLTEEASRVVIPSRLCANDDFDDG